MFKLRRSVYCSALSCKSAGPSVVAVAACPVLYPGLQMIAIFVSVPTLLELCGCGCSLYSCGFRFGTGFAVSKHKHFCGLVFRFH